MRYLFGVVQEIFETEFAKEYPMAVRLFELFDYLPSAYFYAKDAEHRYIGISDLVLRDVFGLKEKSELLGKTDLDFQPPALAEAYHAEDRRAMEGGVRTPSEVWLVPHVSGVQKWYVSTKIPLLAESGEAKGVAGVMYPIETPEARLKHFQEMVPVIRHIEEHFAEQISMEEMAKLTGLSSTQFNHRFRAILHLSPTEFLLKMRLQYVQKLLVESDKTISEISAEAGFYDQSHLTKKFGKINGLTPAQYRKRYRGEG